MPADILVITQSSELGDSIRQTLEATGIYRIHVATNKSSAIVRADELGIPLAMLDYAGDKDWTLEIGSALRTIRPTVNLIILCNEGVSPPAFEALRPWILVRKPFEMSNFMNAISQPENAPRPQSGAETAPLPWLSDQNKAAQHLTRITLESSSQAALITRKNALWAYAGSLSQNAAKEVAQTVTRNWDGQKGSDLLRFIRLESTKAEHMLYATRLAADTMLALVFDSETPFSTIRSQASRLIADLDYQTPETETPAESDEVPQIKDILTDIPAPNPEPATTHEFRLPSKKEPFDPNQTRISTLSEVSVFKREPSPAIPKTSIVVNPPKPAETQPSPAFENLDVTAPSRAKLQPAESAETRVSPTTEAERKLTVEPTTAGMYHLTYACLLVPRFSTHYLTGDLAERVGELLPNICIAFGGR
ncbi:MAG: hypothetical protein LDL51_07925, partial [Chloroflexi bacterium]|nr:hypothetical protein [Chloroflexota bacterium]